MFGFLKSKKALKTPELPPLPGQTEYYEWQGQRMAYSILGQGAPVIILHSINGSGWAWEMRSNLEPLAEQYRVYAPDLPGFGRSERRPIVYSAELYIDWLLDFAHYIARREGQPPAIIVSSLCAAYAIAAARREAAAFGPLLLVAPTGLEKLDFPPTEGSQRFYQRLRGPIGTGLFWFLTTRPLLRVFLSRDGYYDPKFLDPELIEGFHQSARQPYAKFAPICFISFSLNHSVKEEWPHLKGPVLIVWGKQAKTTPPENALLFLSTRPGTEFKLIDQARLSVYDEQAHEFNAVALEWLERYHQPVQLSAPARSDGPGFN